MKGSSTATYDPVKHQLALVHPSVWLALPRSMLTPAAAGSSSSTCVGGFQSSLSTPLLSHRLPLPDDANALIDRTLEAFD